MLAATKASNRKTSSLRLGPGFLSKSPRNRYSPHKAVEEWKEMLFLKVPSILPGSQQATLTMECHWETVKQSQTH